MVILGSSAVGGPVLLFGCPASSARILLFPGRLFVSGGRGPKNQDQHGHAKRSCAYTESDLHGSAPPRFRMATLEIAGQVQWLWPDIWPAPAPSRTSVHPACCIFQGTRDRWRPADGCLGSLRREQRFHDRPL